MNKKKTVKNIKTPNKFNFGGAVNPIGGALSAIGGVAENLISDGFQTKGGAAMSAIGDAVSQIPGAGMIAGPIIKALSGVVNRGFGTKWNEEGLAKAEGQIASLNNFQSGASNYDTLTQDFNKLSSMNTPIKASDLGEDGWFMDRTQAKAGKLNYDMTKAYAFARGNAVNTANNIASDTFSNLERNYAAFGGPLFAYGGQTHGSDFTNGLMFINNGGTHESNPYEGVPISMDREGKPNLVEEGEVIWNDYVFSNRLKVPKSIQKKYKLGKREMTFANAVDKLSKESEERPNDPISIRGLEKTLTGIAMEQENIKNKKNINKNNNKFLNGGLPSVQERAGLDLSPYSRNGKTYYEIPQSILDIISTLNLDKEKSEKGGGGEDGIKNLPTWMRYAPAVGYGALALTDMLGITNKPDYSNADAIIKASNNVSNDTIKFKPIGDYLTYNPFDTEYHANQLRAVSGSTRRNIMNTSGGNRATAMAGLLAADYNTMTQMGDLYRKAAESNLEQKQKVADFNRATNITNSEGFLKASMANQSAKQVGLEGLIKGYSMKEQAKLMSDQAKAANLSGLFTSLGNIGYENANRNMMNWGMANGVWAPSQWKYDPLTGKEITSK